MKKILYLFLFTVSIAVARAQDAAYPASQPVEGLVPAVVYQAPVMYAASVVYQMPVVYNAPVYYVTPTVAPVACAPVAPCPEPPARSTVLYIGGGQVRYQVSSCNSGSTVTYIGGH